MSYHTSSNLVTDQILHIPGTRRRIVVGSPAWFNWLDQPQTWQFHYAGPYGHFTARKEPRNRSFYWYAYLKHRDRLHKKYIAPGPQAHRQTMTPTKLQAVARALQTKTHS